MIINKIAEELSVQPNQVNAAVQLLDEGATVPFIARYRKEVTQGLDDTQLRNLQQRLTYLRELEDRRGVILKSIDEQGKLTDTLKADINNADSKTTLEDLYLPYKKSRKTKAETARKNGLEPLAKIIMSQNANDIENIAVKYIKGEVTSTEDALEGARHIIAEWINERADIRTSLRQQLERYAMISTKVVKTKKDNDEAQKFKD